MSYSVLGLGQPLVDIMIRVSDDFLQRMGLEKGGSVEVPLEKLQEIVRCAEAEFLHPQQQQQQQQQQQHYGSQGSGAINNSSNGNGNNISGSFKLGSYFRNFRFWKGTGAANDDDEQEVKSSNSFNSDSFLVSNMLQKRKRDDFVVVPGGSCCNTIKGMSSLGERCALIGKIGTNRDPMAQIYKESMSEKGVIPLMSESESTPTGHVVCLVTPDGQRTMRAYLGASIEMRETDLLKQDFEGIRLLHVEGYSYYNQKLALCAMLLAKQNQALVSFDLGSFELVRRFKKSLLEVLKKYVDIVFCNEEEARELVNGPPEEACDFLGNLCEVAVVMMGSKGCWVKSHNEKFFCPVTPVEPVDTTGAGDLFASGFLHGYIQGYSLEQCARLGCMAGAAVVQVFGAEVPVEQWRAIKRDVNNHLNHRSRPGSPTSPLGGGGGGGADFTQINNMYNAAANNNIMPKNSNPISIPRRGTRY